MTQLLIPTKLYAPPLRGKLVDRPRLTAKGMATTDRKLMLVSAPAGYGKTTFVSHWLKTLDDAHHVAWLSLNEDDNEPQQFFRYLAAAVASAPGLSHHLAQMLSSPQPLPPRQMMHGLIADVAGVTNSLVLVLDDYHVIDTPAIDEAMALLLAHMPPQMTLVLTTRVDPDLPIARLRARGGLVEIRADDLRFTLEEAGAFLRQSVGGELSAAHLAALEQRTEGWIAGLKMAALSMQGRDDVGGFVENFTGSDRFVLDYLVEEVLHQQPRPVQEFLLRTSILDRFCAPLCDAVCLPEQQSDETPSLSSQQLLDALDQANLFLIPLDNERRWYRYHHLFGDLLRQQLRRRGEPVDELHRRAVRWYEENGLDLEAFQHAAAAGDVALAARLIEGGGTPLHFRGVVAPVLNWLESLPQSALDRVPVLWTVFASSVLVTGQIERTEPMLRAGERALNTAEQSGELSVETIRDLRGRIAAIRATLATGQQDVDTIIGFSEEALSLLHPDNHAFRTSTNWKLGYAYQLRGETEAARRAYVEVVNAGQISGNTLFTLTAMIGLAKLYAKENQLGLAAQTYQRAIDGIENESLPVVCEAYLGLAEVRLAQGDPAAARAILTPVRQRMAAQGLEEETLRLLLMEAIAFHALGKNEPALNLLAQAITLAELGDFTRYFVEAGDAMLDMLKALARQDMENALLRQIIDAFPADASTPQQPLIEPLSERELEVLALIVQGHRNKDIAAELVISLNTVLYHTKNIYGKLGVNKRALAIAKATEYGLV